MATLKRQTAKLFAGNADVTDLGDFGSAKGGNPTNPTAPSIDTDPSIEQQIQTATYETGWTDAVVTSKNFPPIEEVNGVLRTISYQACYLLQEGIPTWDANTEYSATSIVKSINGNELEFYLSLEDNNIGNQINDNTKWIKAIITGDKKIGDPQITLDFTSSLPENCIELRGQAVSRTTYNILFSIYGTTYGAGDGSTTFNLPDFRNRAIYGGASAGYIDAGLPKINITLDYAGNHDHGPGSMEISGSFWDLASAQSGTTMGEAGGAFYTDSQGPGNAVHRAKEVTRLATGGDGIGFRASRTWTGRTEQKGNHTHPISVSISGVNTNADSIYTNGIKVRVFTRYK